MINLKEYRNMEAMLQRISDMQELKNGNGQDALDRIIEEYAPAETELSFEDLQFATAAVKMPELPDYLKK